MSNLTKEQVKEAYAKLLKFCLVVLYRQALMILLSKSFKMWTRWLARLPIAHKNIAKIGIDIIYKATIGRVVDAATGYFDNILIDTLLDEATSDIQDKIEELFSAWVMALIGNRRFVACLYQARRNWRSKIQIELMGL